MQAAGAVGPGRSGFIGRMSGGGAGLTIWLVALVASLPLAVALLSFFSDSSGVWPHLARYVLPEALANTTWLVFGVASCTSVLGVSLAWFVASCEFPGRRFFNWALLMPMAMPGYVLGFAFAALFEYTGPVQAAWRSLFGSSAYFPGIGPRGASIATLSLVLYPYVFLIVREAFASQGIRGLEVARSFGYRPVQAFFKVTLPMARPWFVAGLSLAVMECLADFGTVKLFNYTTFTTAIYRSWYGLFSLQSALQLSLVLVSLVLIALFLERRLRGKSRYAPPGAARQRRIVLSRGKAAGVALYCASVLIVAFGLPVSLIVAWSVENFAAEFDAAYWKLALNTLVLSSGAAAMITAVAVLLTVTVRRSPSVLNRSLSRIATLGYAIPGTVLAVGFFVPVAWLSRVFNEHFGDDAGTVVALQSGLAVIFLAYLARFLAVAHSPVESALQRIRPSIEEAARGMGVSGLRLLGRVHLPILRPAIFTAALLVFVDIMKELPITLMTRPFGWDTLAVKVFQLTTEGEWQRAALPAVAIVVAGLLPVILLSRQRR
ncbi:MAG: iron ABC transporter permease [Woeseia sp.]